MDKVPEVYSNVRGDAVMAMQMMEFNEVRGEEGGGGDLGLVHSNPKINRCQPRTGRAGPVGRPWEKRWLFTHPALLRSRAQAAIPFSCNAKPPRAPRHFPFPLLLMA